MLDTAALLDLWRPQHEGAGYMGSFRLTEAGTVLHVDFANE